MDSKQHFTVESYCPTAESHAKAGVRVSARSAGGDLSLRLVMVRTQPSLDSELHRRARDRAAARIDASAFYTAVDDEDVLRFDGGHRLAFAVLR